MNSCRLLYQEDDVISNAGQDILPVTMEDFGFEKSNARLPILRLD